jgi:antibiotic biosynthesis monooxygenase (ABM) superfamily enzyme
MYLVHTFWRTFKNSPYIFLIIFLVPQYFLFPTLVPTVKFWLTKQTKNDL